MDDFEVGFSSNVSITNSFVLSDSNLFPYSKLTRDYHVITQVLEFNATPSQWGFVVKTLLYLA